MKTFDFYGNLIAEGVQVAFNYQGELRKGVVVKVTPRTQYGKTHCEWGAREPYLTIHVQHEMGTQLSKVTNRKNLVVIA